MASAWLIRRFIDPEGRFKFVNAREYRHKEGELRFDMFDGGYTHKGELCTFEVLLQTFRDHRCGTAPDRRDRPRHRPEDEKYGRPPPPGSRPSSTPSPWPIAKADGDGTDYRFPSRIRAQS